MAEFNYFGTKEELVSLLQSALASGYWVQQKTHMTEPVPLFCRTPADVVNVVAKGQYAFLLTHPNVSRFPIGLHSFERDGARFWAIRTSEGGPGIEVYYWATYEKDGERIIPCWLLAYHSKIINPDTNQTEPAGDQMKKAFSELTGALRKNARRVKTMNNSIAYVSKGVEAMLAAGWVLGSQAK